MRRGRHMNSIAIEDYSVKQRSVWNTWGLMVNIKMFVSVNLEIIGQFRLTVILKSCQQAEYKDYGIDLIGYSDEEALLRIISSFS